MPGSGARQMVCFGPGPKFKGGISNYNTALAKALDAKPNTEVHIVSWTQQYPAIIPREFVDKSSKFDFLEGTDIQVHYVTNYNNPFSWHQTFHLISGLDPDIMIFQGGIALQRLPMGRIARLLRRHPGIEAIFDLHFVIQKEGSRLGSVLPRDGIQKASAYITHAYKTLDELKDLMPGKNFAVNETGMGSVGQTTVIKLFHPIYDWFKPDPQFDVEKFKSEHGLKQHVFLFFGFIRKYKGLHYAIEAFAKLGQERDDVSLLICGESFWKTLDQRKLSTRIKSALFGMAKNVFLKKSDDEGDYRPLEMIEKLRIKDSCMVVNEFVPNEDVHQYFQVSDAVLLFYECAAPSGVESLGYNFKLPLLASRVGHFPETIQDGYNGYLAEAGDTDSMRDQMQRFIESPLSGSNVESATSRMSWSNCADASLNR